MVVVVVKRTREDKSRGENRFGNGRFRGGKAHCGKLHSIWFRVYMRCAAECVRVYSAYVVVVVEISKNEPNYLFCVFSYRTIFSLPNCVSILFGGGVCVVFVVVVVVKRHKLLFGCVNYFYIDSSTIQYLIISLSLA